MFDENDKVNAYVKQKNIGMKIDYNDKARRVLKTNAPQGKSPADDAQAEELDGASRAMRRIIQQKLLNGDELMADEMRFLKRSDTGLYTKARTAQDAREALVQKLEAATSKEEASEAFLLASGLVNEAGSAARQKDAAAKNPAPPSRSGTSTSASSAARDAFGAPKPRTRWKLDTSSASSASSAKGAATKTAAKTQAAAPQPTNEKRTGSAPPPKTSTAFVQQPEDTTGIEFIMARALQAAWAKFTQTAKYRDLTSTTERSVENLDPASMTVATRFFSASRAYRNLPKPRKGAPMQSFDSET
ncbi:hypothetical protein [uncultured Selenomonas sp.]|uniref:hypothetical protein n=1 Tax=uncultured Selenomonas sp. TaxID=159275 RepID=UPI0028DBACEF|nr:hypothetical protein [uncultured Selenomonas sp.]